MKRLYKWGAFFLLGCLAWPGALFAYTETFQWGILRETVNDTSFDYAIDHLIDKRPIRYVISKKVHLKDRMAFRKSFHQWPQETLKYIRESNRRKEFRDILPILKHELALESVPLESKADIYFDYADDMEKTCSLATYGCFYSSKPFKIFIQAHRPMEMDLSSTILHEVGHYFGLADQYTSARQNAHAEYSSDVNYKDKALMQGSLATNGEITCDDADGFINLIDLRLAQRNGGQFSARAQKGWKSLCPNSKNIYQNAKTINRHETDIVQNKRDNKEVVQVRTYQDGILKNKTLYRLPLVNLTMFYVSDKAEVERDPKTHLIRSIREKGAPDVLYERHFTYTLPTERKKRKMVEVHIKELLNGRAYRHFTVLVSADGKLTGLPNVHELEKFSYRIHSYKPNNKDVVTVDLRFKGNAQEPSGHNFRLHDHKEDITIHGTFDFMKLEETVQKVISKGEILFPTGNISQDTPFIGRTCRGSYQMICDLLMQQVNGFASYYQNFYEPLFGNQRKAVRKELRKQIKKGLDASR